jgi:predicted signal transduction protein with EAL and GGDEF domain
MRSVVRKAGEITPEPSALSLSVGVAHYPADGADPQELLAEADRRMYKSKRLRRKAVVPDLSPPAETPVTPVAVVIPAVLPVALPVALPETTAAAI